MEWSKFQSRPVQQHRWINILCVWYILISKAEFEGKNQKEKLRKLVVASGRSFLDPLFDANDLEDKNASRRIEIKFSLKNEEAIKEIEAILDNK